MRHLEERDLRSLERPGLYKIFAPLDPNEQLPRELLIESRRYRSLGRTELAGALWLPTLFVILALSGWLTTDVTIVLGLIALVYVGFWIFAHSDRRT